MDNDIHRSKKPIMQLNTMKTQSLLKADETVIHISTKRKTGAKKEKQLLQREFTL